MENREFTSSGLHSPMGQEPASETSANVPAVLVVHRNPTPQQPMSPGQPRQAALHLATVTYSRSNTVVETVTGGFLTSSAGLGRHVRTPHTAPVRLMNSSKTLAISTPVQNHDRGSADESLRELRAQYRLSQHPQITDVNFEKLKFGQETIANAEVSRQPLSRPHTEIIRSQGVPVAATASRFGERTLLQRTGYGIANPTPSHVLTPEQFSQSQNFFQMQASKPQQPHAHRQLVAPQREQFSGEQVVRNLQQTNQSQQPQSHQISQPQEVLGHQISQPQQMPQCQISQPQQMPQHQISQPQQMPQRQISQPQQMPQRQISQPQQMPQRQISQPQQVSQCQKSQYQEQVQCQQSLHHHHSQNHSQHKTSEHHFGHHSRVHSRLPSTDEQLGIASGCHQEKNPFWDDMTAIVMMFSAKDCHAQMSEELTTVRKCVQQCELKIHSSV